MDKLDKQIGEKLKMYRERKNYTMREVAERIGIDHSYISKIEKGKIPSLQKLKQLCDLYEVEVASLFGEEVQTPDKLKDAGVNWIRFIGKMEERDMTPEEIEIVLNAFKVIKKM